MCCGRHGHAVAVRQVTNSESANGSQTRKSELLRTGDSRGEGIIPSLRTGLEPEADPGVDGPSRAAASGPLRTILS